MMVLFARLPLRRKLVAMIMAASAVVLLIASTGYLLADYRRARGELAEDARRQAAVLGEAVSASLAFDRVETADEVLATLFSQPNVRAACLYHRDGRLFSQYVDRRALPCPAAAPADGADFRDGRMHFAAGVLYREERWGTLYIRTDIGMLERRLREQLLITVGLLLLALALALPLSAWLQRSVSEPIVGLARTAADISARGDYSLRAKKVTGDEIGLLVDDFNRMVERVQRRDAELSKANEDLRREIVERQRAEQERAALLVREREANRLKDEFLATLSHELRTPLNAILGWTRLLRTNAVPPADVDRALEKVERNAQSQTRLVEDLLDVSRIASGKLRLDIRALDLVTLVNTAVESIRPAAETRGVLIERRFEAVSLPTAGDPDRLQQVVWNLLSNAVKFTPAGGRVTVALRRHPGEDEVTITDTGIGIPPAFLPHVFETFRQADGSATRAHGGLGLGLAIVRQLAEMHGGRVSAVSAGDNTGASFTVRLPVRAMPHEPRAAAVADLSGRPLADRLVVVVDDDEDTRELVTSVLKRAGATVVVASSASEGLAACLEHRPDVLVSDIAMPGEDGYGLMDRLKAALGAHAPRVNIALTAFAGPRERDRSSMAGFHAHLAKPFEPGELVSVISNLLETSHASSPLRSKEV